MIPTAVSQLEMTIVSQASAQLGRRVYSNELETMLIQMIREHAQESGLSRLLPILMRLAVKACPYGANVDALLADHSTILLAWAKQTMPDLIATVEACNRLALPVPIIVSCEKYLEKALGAQAAFKDRYFGITPIITRGNGEALEEKIDACVLCLPVNDSYEGLPVKMFETFVLLNAIGAERGIIKLDDDLQVVSSASLDLQSLQREFASSQYTGLALRSIHHDRLWHLGKCLSPVPVAYGKPFRAPWARGALYHVSGFALQILARQYLRFPGCLEGELYEDKAIGDVLHEAGVMLRHFPLEPLLGVSTDAPDRLVAAE